MMEGYMKIALVTEVYHPSVNGVVISIDTFRNELCALGHDVIIIAPQNKYKHSDPTDTYRIPSLSIPWTKDYVMSRPDASSYELLRKQKVDIIHTQHMFAMGWFGLRAGQKYSIPVVHTYHTLITEYTHHIPLLGSFIPTRWMIQKYLINHTRRYGNAVNALITPSHAMAHILRSYGIRRKVNVVSTGINIKSFDVADGDYIYTRHGLPKNVKIVLFVGRLASEKSVDLLIRSYAELQKFYTHTRLILLGSGPQQQEYEALAHTLGISGKVLFPGFVKPDIARHYFRAAYIFAFPSHTDTQGIVIAEAMAAGAAVVAVNKLGPTDIIKNGYNGLLVMQTVTSMSNALQRLLTNKAFHDRLVRSACESVKRYSTQVQTHELVKVYTETIRSYASGGPTGI
ncbi:hypothetical protein COS66_02750 [Candidatus Berkelbacteria bacterium CG06_land_8_20_14_3_00_43_10]|nr:MAG: hypothetical protein COS66_02750 [Candidatus Berkelbacteria bacterium CG06_land_8_20_14_3_00_43_10]